MNDSKASVNMTSLLSNSKTDLSTKNFIKDAGICKAHYVVILHFINWFILQYLIKITFIQLANSNSSILAKTPTNNSAWFQKLILSYMGKYLVSYIFLGLNSYTPQ